MRLKQYLLVLLMLTMYLGLSNGHLAIYSSQDPCPLQILPYDAAMFCEADQQALAKGIPFTSAEELNKLLEDYTS